MPTLVPGGAESSKKWYTVKEASDYLGVSQPTIFRWMKDGILSFYKVGGSTRFSQEGLDSVIEKSTGQKEAESIKGKCPACGHSILIEGKVQGTGRLYFRPERTKFWTFQEALVPVSSRVCAACGHVQFLADTEKLTSLMPDEDREAAERVIEEENDNIVD
ncbi:MAG: helix-turn-helix domain-containing protein [Planctomycetes bacterium]|nr:helix-turn-helix domain-containing protein [Planctomycetota bacterium]